MILELKYMNEEKIERDFGYIKKLWLYKETVNAIKEIASDWLII